MIGEKNFYRYEGRKKDRRKIKLKDEYQMYCKKCGTDLKSGGKYCPKCGAPVKNPQKRKKGLAVLCILLVLAVFGGGFFLYRYKEIKYNNHMAAAEDYKNQGDMQNAEACYQEAIETRPEQAAPYDELLKIYWASSALEDFSEMARRGNENTEEGKHFEFLAELSGKYKMYQDYEEVFNEYAASASGISNAVGIVQTYGLCFSELLDFNSDGTDELMLAYTETRYDDIPENLPYPTEDFTIEVWGYQDSDKEIVREFVGNPLQDGNGQWIVQEQVQDGGPIYLRAKNENDGSELYYSYQNEAVDDSSERQIKVYVLEGDTNSAGVAVEDPWSERIRTEQELFYRKEAIDHAVKRELNLEETVDKLPVPQSSYAQESDDLLIYVCSYLNEENIPALSVRYCAEYETSWLEFFWNEEKRIYEPGEENEGEETSLAVEAKEDTLYLYLETSSLEEGIRAELQRETQYDFEYPEAKQKTTEEENGEVAEEEVMDSRQLDEEGVAYATQQFLDEKNYQTLDPSNEYKAADPQEVFRYNEVLWVPIYRNEESNPAYYAVIASGEFEDPGQAEIYPSEIYSIIEGTGIMSEFTSVETFDANQYL